MDSWVMLGQSKMMSRPVSIGTGVREIIGGSVQTVFAVGGTMILLDPLCSGIENPTLYNSVNHNQQINRILLAKLLKSSRYLYHPVFY